MAGIVTNRSIKDKKKLREKRASQLATSDRTLSQQALPRPTLTDGQLETFIRQGYLVLEGVAGKEFNERIIRESDRALEESGFERGVHNFTPIGNNIAAAVPDLTTIVMNANDNEVSGALASILGQDYILHKHLMGMNNEPGSRPQTIHKDSFAGFSMRRSHTPWWCMVMYYPQDTPVELAATSIVPGSQYLHPEGGFDERHLQGEVAEGYLKAWGTAEQRMVCKAGTAVIVHKDLFHRGMNNTTNRRRWMFKYEVLRSSFPCERVPLPLRPDSRLAAVHSHVAAWLAGCPGVAVVPSQAQDCVVGASDEVERLSAAYCLGTDKLLQLLADPAIDKDEAAVRAVRHALSAALFRSAVDVGVDELLLFTETAARTGRHLAAATCLVSLAESGQRLSECSTGRVVDFLASFAGGRSPPGGTGHRNILSHALLGLGLLGTLHPGVRGRATGAIVSFLQRGAASVEAVNGNPSMRWLGEALMEAGLACVRLVRHGETDTELLGAIVALCGKIATVDASKNHPRLPGKGGAPGADQGLRYAMAFLITALCRSGSGLYVSKCYAALKAYGKVGPAVPSEAWALENRWCHLTHRDSAF